MKLTSGNYFSPEANMEYMSASQFKSFRTCEAAALAELRGEWMRTETPALRLGSYVDAILTGNGPAYLEAHPELLKRDGTLRAETQSAQIAAGKLLRDELACMLLSGRHQVIQVGKIGGVRFKRFPEVRKIVPLGGGMIVDLKYMRDFSPIWSDEYQDRISFAEYWGYDIQGAIYQALDRRNAPFIIVAASKESEPDIEAIHIPDETLQLSLEEVAENAPRYDAIKRGRIAPVGCGKCAYCRSIKQLTRIRHYKDLT